MISINLFIVYSTILLVIIIQPLWSIYHCIKTQPRLGSRVIWVIGMLLLGSFITIPFALFAGSSQRLRQLTWLCIPFVIAMALLYNFGTSHQSQRLMQRVDKQIVALNQIDLHELNQTEQHQLRQALLSLKEAASDNAVLQTFTDPISSYQAINGHNQLTRVKILLDLFSLYTQTNHFTHQAYLAWVTDFDELIHVSLYRQALLRLQGNQLLNLA